MMRLRLTVQIDPAGVTDLFVVDAELQDASQTWKESGRMSFSLSDNEREDLRWYWEEYANSVSETAGAAAERAHLAIAATGHRLFQSIFDQNPDLRLLWERAASSAFLRVEIACADADSDRLPWELMRTPGGSYVAVQATEFTRVSLDQAAEAPTVSENLRILIIISRPFMTQDVSYQTVIRTILQKADFRSPGVQLCLLRPPTFEAMKSTLSAAAKLGQPFQTVHFDGHGVYMDGANPPLGAFLSPPKPGRRGYLLFEKPVDSHVSEISEANLHYVTGEEFGTELVANGVQAAIFNACRSGYAVSPDAADYVLQSRSQFWQSNSFGSLANEVMGTGLLGVVAMRYDVHVQSIATYMSEFYQHLAHGSSLSAASTRARRLLFDAPPLKIHDAHSLEDWPVPVCYERVTAALAKVLETASPTAASSSPVATDFASVPSPVRAQDRTIFFLDRAFDTSNVVCLNGLRGSGKTAVAAQFANWYGATGATSKTLWTQLDAKPSASAILDAAADRLRDELLPKRYEMGRAEGSVARARLLAGAIAESNLLWIWDSLDDLLAGGVLDASTVSEEIAVFVTLIAKLATSRVKLLLVSRAQWNEWLPVRKVSINTVKFDYMDSVRLLNAYGAPPRWLGSTEASTHFLAWADGNPQALGLALYTDTPSDMVPGRPPNDPFDNWASRALAGHHPECAALRRAVVDFVAEVRSTLGDDAVGTLRTIGLFRGRIFLESLRATSSGTYQEQWKQLLAVMARFGLAASASLLPPEQETDWLLHPLLSPALFAATRIPPSAQETEQFIETVATLGAVCHDLYTHGRREFARLANDHSGNFYDAWYRARSLRLAQYYRPILAGLMVVIYHHRGDAQSWTKLIETVLPDFVDSQFSSFKSGSEVAGLDVIQMYIQPLMDLGREAEVERALTLVQPVICTRALPILEKAGQLNKDEIDQLLALFNIQTSMGELLMKRGDAGCLSFFNDSLQFSERSGDPTFIAIACLNLGAAHYGVVHPPDLAKADQYLQRSLALRKDGDFLGRGRCQFHLGNLHKVAWTAQLQDLSALLRLAASNRVRADAQIPMPREALAHFEKAISLLNGMACFELYASHLAVAELNVMMHLSMQGLRSSILVDASIQHFSRAVELAAILGDNPLYARTHLEAADLLKQTRRFDAARDHAKAALEVYGKMGQDGMSGKREAQQVLRDIEVTEARRPYRESQ